MAIKEHELIKEFNYGVRILEVYNLEEARRVQREELDRIETKIKNLRASLPEDVVTLYDEYRTCMKLRGDTAESPSQDDWQAAQILYQQQNELSKQYLIAQNASDIYIPTIGFQQYFQEEMMNRCEQKIKEKLIYRG